ncbi:MAG TPA: DinB family protein [Symbiobacteriaceae bacterium]|nr:DinB family protein [Symbiobacteriaceae bacterium]
MIGYAAGIAAALEFGIARVKDLLKDMTPEQLEAVPPGYANSIATLLVHTYGLEARLGYDLQGQKMPPEVAEELLLTLPRTQTLPAVKGETAASLLARVEKSRSLLMEGLGALTEEGLDRELEMGPGRTIVVRRLLALLPQHQGQHFGHMQFIKKALG